MGFPLGVVDVVYVRRGDIVERSRVAAADGYAHIDPMVGTDPATLALPVGCPTAFPKPVAEWCSTPAPTAQLDGAWERALRWWKAAPPAPVGPGAGATINSRGESDAFRQGVPSFGLLVATGHGCDWGG